LHLLLLITEVKQDQDQVQGFHALRARLPFVLSKGSKTAFAGRDPPHKTAAVPCALRLPRHAAQTRCARTWAALRPRQAAVLGSLYGSQVKVNG